MQGKMIQIASRLKKKLFEEQIKLENKIKQLELEHKSTGSCKVLLELKKLGRL